MIRFPLPRWSVPDCAEAPCPGAFLLAERALALAARRLPRDQSPEYYDGKGGRLIGRHANLRQTWSAAALILSHRLLEDPSLLSLLPE